MFHIYMSILTHTSEYYYVYNVKEEKMDILLLSPGKRLSLYIIFVDKVSLIYNPC